MLIAPVHIDTAESKHNTPIHHTINQRRGGGELDETHMSLSLEENILGTRYYHTINQHLDAVVSGEIWEEGLEGHGHCTHRHRTTTLLLIGPTEVGYKTGRWDETWECAWVNTSGWVCESEMGYLYFVWFLLPHLL